MSAYTEASLEPAGYKANGRAIFRAVGGFRFYVGYLGSSIHIDVPDGFLTDGPSAPEWALRLLPKFWAQSLAKPSCVHDLLREDPHFDKFDGDVQFLCAMKAAKVPAPLMWVAFFLVLSNGSRAQRNPALWSSKGPPMIGPDQLADRFRDNFDQLHQLIEAHPDLKQRSEIQKQADLFHAAGDRFLKKVKAMTHPTGKPIVQPFSGGEPKPNP